MKELSVKYFAILKLLVSRFNHVNEPDSHIPEYSMPIAFNTLVLYSFEYGESNNVFLATKYFISLLDENLIDSISNPFSIRLCRRCRL